MSSDMRTPWGGLAVASSRDWALLGLEAAGLVLSLVAGAEQVAHQSVQSVLSVGDPVRAGEAR